jgi:hypothetical protein
MNLIIHSAVCSFYYSVLDNLLGALSNTLSHSFILSLSLSFTHSSPLLPPSSSFTQDNVYIEEMAHFDRERVPERVVHAKGAGTTVSCMYLQNHALPGHRILCA